MRQGRNAGRTHRFSRLNLSVIFYFGRSVPTMYRYIRSSDYFPTSNLVKSAQYSNNSRYFFPPPILPYTNGSDLNRRTHFCGSSSHVGHSHCTGDKPCTSTAGPIQGMREHSLKKILPWRSEPELDKDAAGNVPQKSQYTGRDVKYPATENVAAIFEPPIPERFPNLVTESNLYAGHGTQSCTLSGAKYSPKEWVINNRQLCTGAECIHNNVTVVQSDVKQCIAENSKVQVRSLIDTEQDLDKRISEVEDWTNKLQAELQYNVDMAQRVAAMRDKVDAVVQNLEKPLDISRENLYQREARQGVESVHDNVEESLFREIEKFRHAKEDLQGFAFQLGTSQNNLRAARHELEMDISNKQYAYGTDTCVRSLNEKSNMILTTCTSARHGGCTGKCTTPVQNSRGKSRDGLDTQIPHSHSSPASWLANTQSIIQKSAGERSLAHGLCQEVHNTLGKLASECTKHWSQTSTAFNTRILEIQHAIKMMEAHLQKINFDIGQVHSNRCKVKQIIDEKKPALQLAQTRLEKRKERTGLELCRDKVTISLLQEIHVLKNAIQELSIQFANMNQLHQQLVTTKAKLEHDLKLKKMAHAIDAERCMEARRALCMNKVFV